MSHPLPNSDVMNVILSSWCGNSSGFCNPDGFSFGDATIDYKDTLFVIVIIGESKQLRLPTSGSIHLQDHQERITLSRSKNRPGFTESGAVFVFTGG